MTARKSNARRSSAAAADAGDDSLTPKAGRKTSTARRVLLNGDGANVVANTTMEQNQRPRAAATALAAVEEPEYDDDRMDEGGEYEFKAPKYHDFMDQDEEDGADEWFDTKAASPLEPGEPRAALDLDEDEEPEEEEFHDPQRPSELMPNRTSLRVRNSSIGAKQSMPARKTLGKPAKASIAPKPAAPPKPAVDPESFRKNLTIPKEFNFQTNARKAHVPARGGSGHGMTLRTTKGGGVQKKTKPGKQSSKAPQAKPTLTIPQPFQFQTAFKALTKESNVVAPKSPFVPLAVQVQQFDRKLSPAGKKKGPRAFKVASPKLTQARSPRLMTKIRSKPTNLPTTEERELMELGVKFRANPINHGVLNNPVTRRRGNTKPQLTIPMSPAIHKPKGPAPLPPSPPRIIKANPIPEYAPFVPSLPHRAIVPEEVALPGDEISRRRRQELEEQIRKEQEENRRKRRFIAQPLPDDFPDDLPEVEMKPLTYPEPFMLQSDLRGQSHRRKLEEQLERDRREKENKTKFKAQPFREVEPFIPSKSSKPITEPEHVMLHSELRAEERRAFEEELKEKEKLAEEMRQRQLRDQEAREKQEVAKLRKNAVHKAEPIRAYAPIVIKPSNKPLTDAESPMIGDKRRRMAGSRSLLQNVSTSSN